MALSYSKDTLWSVGVVGFRADFESEGKARCSSQMNTPPGSPGGRAQVPPASPLEKKGAALFVEVSGDDSDGASDEDDVYPLHHENPRTTHMKDVQQMHIPRLQLNGVRHSDALDPMGDTAFLPLETPTDLDLDQLFERTDQRTDFNFSHVQIVEENHILEPETQEACREIEYFLQRRDRYVFRKPTRYWGGIDRSKMRAKNKGPLGRWRHEPKVPFTLFRAETVSSSCTSADLCLRLCCTAV